MPVGVGEPDFGYPWPWAVSRWLDGEVATVEALGDSAEAAVATGRVPDRAAALRLPTRSRPGRDLTNRPLPARDEETRAAIAEVDGVFDAAALTSVWDAALSAPGWDRPPVWFHGDFHTGNLLTVAAGSARSSTSAGSASAIRPAI